MTPSFELLRFEAVPASASVAVLELDGRWDGPPPARVRLLVERGGRSVEVPAVTADGETPWSATFAIALDDLGDPATDLSLVPGRGALIALPAPEHGDGGGIQDRYVQLARQTSALRRRVFELEDAAAAHEDELRSVERAGAANQAEITVARTRADEAAAAAREELAAADARTADAERTIAALRDQRDSSAATADRAREALDRAREQLRDSEARLLDTERERASVRARAEAAERATADLRRRAADTDERVKRAEARAVAAEDETRSARRDLRDTRARLESLLREQRHQPAAERRGHEVPEPLAPDDNAIEGEGEAANENETVALDTQPADDTAVHETAQIDRATPDETGNGDVPDDEDTGEHPAAPVRRARVVRIFDDPMAEGGTDEVLEPAAVGARFIEPAKTAGPALTPARIMVGVALALLFVALLAILLGAGIV